MKKVQAAEMRQPIETVQPERSPAVSRFKEMEKQAEACQRIFAEAVNDWVAAQITGDGTEMEIIKQAVIREVEEEACDDVYNDKESYFRKVYDAVAPAAIERLRQHDIPFVWRDQKSYSEGLVVTPEKLRQTFYFLVEQGIFGYLEDDEEDDG